MGAILFAGLLWIAGPAESFWAVVAAGLVVVGVLSLWLGSGTVRPRWRGVDSPHGRPIGLFGLGHVWTWDLWGVFPAVSAFVFGLVMTWLFVWRGNLLGPIVAHATVNGAVVGVALLMPPTLGLMLDPVGTAATCQMAFVTSESLETIQRGEFARTRTIDTSGTGWRNFRDDLATLEQTATRSGNTTAIELTSVWIATAHEQESAVTAGREPDFGAVFMAGAELLLACTTAGHQPLDPPVGDSP